MRARQQVAITSDKHGAAGHKKQQHSTYGVQQAARGSLQQLHGSKEFGVPQAQAPGVDAKGGQLPVQLPIDARQQARARGVEVLARARARAGGF